MTILKRLLKLTFIAGVLFVVLSTANYYRLSKIKPEPQDVQRQIDKNTIHGHGHKVFNPTEVDISGRLTQVSSYVPEMGTHYIILSRLFTPFDPKKPTGIMRDKDGKLVGYFYSTFSPDLDYHWHFHRNFCLKEGLVPTTELSIPQCLIKGYYWFPFNTWMMHVFLEPVGSEGVNGMYNENIK